MAKREIVTVSLSGDLLESALRGETRNRSKRLARLIEKGLHYEHGAVGPDETRVRDWVSSKLASARQTLLRVEAALRPRPELSDEMAANLESLQGRLREVTGEVKALRSEADDISKGVKSSTRRAYGLAEETKTLLKTVQSLALAITETVKSVSQTADDLVLALGTNAGRVDHCINELQGISQRVEGVARATRDFEPALQKGLVAQAAAARKAVAAELNEFEFREEELDAAFAPVRSALPTSDESEAHDEERIAHTPDPFDEVGEGVQVVREVIGDDGRPRWLPVVEASTPALPKAPDDVL